MNLRVLTFSLLHTALMARWSLHVTKAIRDLGVLLLVTYTGLITYTVLYWKHIKCWDSFGEALVNQFPLQSKGCYTLNLFIPIYTQRSRKMKILWGTAQGGTFYMSHTYLLQSQVILDFGLRFLHFELSYKQKDLTDYKHWNHWENFSKARAQKCKFERMHFVLQFRFLLLWYLMYYSVIWRPYLRKDILLLERVQRHATTCISIIYLTWFSSGLYKSRLTHAAKNTTSDNDSGAEWYCIFLKIS